MRHFKQDLRVVEMERRAKRESEQRAFFPGVNLMDRPPRSAPDAAGAGSEQSTERTSRRRDPLRGMNASPA
jgi:hypothetical protein